MLENVESGELFPQSKIRPFKCIEVVAIAYVLPLKNMHKRDTLK